jgi:hypothetical protein
MGLWQWQIPPVFAKMSRSSKAFESNGGASLTMRQRLLIAVSLALSTALWFSGRTHAQELNAGRLLTSVSLLAQAPASDAAPKSGVVTVNRQYTFLDYSLVVIVIGVAVYSVCRSSRRN